MTRYAVTSRWDSAPAFSPEQTYARLIALGAKEPRPGFLLDVIATLYEFGVLVRLNPDLMTAHCANETGNPHTGVPMQSPIYLNRGVIDGLGVTDGGDMGLAFASGRDAALAHLVHLHAYVHGVIPVGSPLFKFIGLDPRYVLVIAGPNAGIVRTVKDMTGKWWTDPDGHNAVIKQADSIFSDFTLPHEGGQPVGAKIILNMGHRDTTGGGTAGGGFTEQGYTDNIVVAIRDALRAAGHEAYVNQELDGDVDNTFMNKNLDYVGRNAVLIDQQFGPVDAYLSIHLEGSTAPGLFAIVPDGNGLISAATGAPDPGDTWADNPRDVAFARALATRCSASTGLGKRSTTESGVMSERATGVGGSGWRLSEFHETVPMRAHATRNILECGAMPNAHDIAIIRQPDFPAKIAAGVVAAVNDVFGAPVVVEPPKPPAKPKSQLPSEERLSRLFGTVRAYSTNGPVSKVWREWCFANGLYPALERVYLAAGGFTDYIFANGLYIRFNPKTNAAYLLTKENAA